MRTQTSFPTASITRVSAVGQRLYVMPDDSGTQLVFRSRGESYYCIGDEAATLDFSETGDPLTPGA
mgnify:CR=1 FL=1